MTDDSLRNLLVDISDATLKAVEAIDESEKYKKAFTVACELLNGGILYGYDSDRIFSEMMKKDGVVSSFSYEEFILNNLDRLSGEGK